MNLEVIRFSSGTDSTNGILFETIQQGNEIDGIFKQTKFLAYTLEDEYRSEKVFGEITVVGQVADTGTNGTAAHTPWGQSTTTYTNSYTNHSNIMNLYERYARDGFVTNDETLPTFIFHKIYDPPIYGYELIFLWWQPDGTPRFKSVVLKQCEAEDATPAQQAEIWDNLRAEVWNSPEYQELFYSIFPIQDMIASMSLYEYTALGDKVYFRPTYYGINLHDMLARTKLSAIQAFTSAKHGYRNMNYTDPYERKSGTDYAPLSDLDFGLDLGTTS